MGNTILGKVIYYWIFIIGGMFISRLFGMPQDAKTTIVFLVILTCFYWGLAFLRASGKKRRERKENERR